MSNHGDPIDDPKFRAWWNALGEQRSCDRRSEPVPIGQVLRAVLPQIVRAPAPTQDKPQIDRSK